MRPLWLLPLMCLSAAAQAADASSSGSDEAALQTMRAEIVKLIGEPRCVNLVHCRVLPLGARPCGGPSEYLAYGSTTADREILEAKAYEYTFLQEEINRQKQAVGACAVLPEPRVNCVGGRCMLNSDAR